MNYRNQELIDLARLAPHCMGCGKHNEGDVVSAHANWSDMGKSSGSKAHDFAVAFLGTLCCHAPLDQGSAMSGDDKRAFWMRAFWRTQEWLWTSGHVAAHRTPQPQPIAKPKPKAKIAGRKLQSGAKIQSRGFETPATPKPWPKRSFPKRAKP